MSLLNSSQLLLPYISVHEASGWSSVYYGAAQLIVLAWNMLVKTFITGNEKFIVFIPDKAIFFYNHLSVAANDTSHPTAIFLLSVGIMSFVVGAVIGLSFRCAQAIMHPSEKGA